MINLVTYLADACTGQSLLPNLYAGLQDSKCEVSIDSFQKIAILLANVVSILMFIVGLVAVGFIIYGGFQYMLSSGEPSGIKKAKDTIVNAVIGLVIAMLAFGIVRFVTGSFSATP